MNRSKKVRERKDRNKFERYMKRIHGPNWRSKFADQKVIPVPHDWQERIGPGLHYVPKMPVARALTVEEIRLQLKRAAGITPGTQPKGYTEGVSPNA
jgi:hypothetical protein